MVLPEQSAQFKRRSLAAVAHDRRRGKAGAIDLPADDRRRDWTCQSPLAVGTPLAPFAPGSTGADDLLVRTRADAGCVTLGNKASAVPADDVERPVLSVGPPGAAHRRRDRITPVTAGHGELDPIRMRRFLRGVPLCLPGAARVCDDVTAIGDRVRRKCPVFFALWFGLSGARHWLKW
jgi:hypothetical protein